MIKSRHSKVCPYSLDKYCVAGKSDAPCNLTANSTHGIFMQGCGMPVHMNMPLPWPTTSSWLRHRLASSWERLLNRLGSSNNKTPQPQQTKKKQLSAIDVETESQLCVFVSICICKVCLSFLVCMTLRNHTASLAYCMCCCCIYHVASYLCPIADNIFIS